MQHEHDVLHRRERSRWIHVVHDDGADHAVGMLDGRGLVEVWVVPVRARGVVFAQSVDTGEVFSGLHFARAAVGGGWGKVARGVWSQLAKSSALAMGELQTDTFCAILFRQRLSTTLHPENARACLRRFGC